MVVVTHHAYGNSLQQPQKRNPGHLHASHPTSEFRSTPSLPHPLTHTQSSAQTYKAQAWTCQKVLQSRPHWKLQNHHGTGLDFSGHWENACESSQGPRNQLASRTGEKKNVLSHAKGKVKSRSHPNTAPAPSAAICLCFLKKKLERTNKKEFLLQGWGLPPPQQPAPPSPLATSSPIPGAPQWGWNCPGP